MDARAAGEDSIDHLEHGATIIAAAAVAAGAAVKVKTTKRKACTSRRAYVSAFCHRRPTLGMLLGMPTAAAAAAVAAVTAATYCCSKPGLTCKKACRSTSLTAPPPGMLLPRYNT